MRHLVRLLLVLAAFVAAAPVLAQQGGPALEMPSKDDAREWFSMNKERWQANVRRKVAAGAASALEAPETGVEMVTRTVGGEIMIIKPFYLSRLSKPDAIHVTVSYRGSKAANLTDSVVEEAVHTARRRLEPEYELNDAIDRTGRQLLVVLEILEAVPE